MTLRTFWTQFGHKKMGTIRSKLNEFLRPVFKPVQVVGINEGGIDIGVAQAFFNTQDIRSVHKRDCRERMPQGMSGDLRGLETGGFKSRGDKPADTSHRQSRGLIPVGVGCKQGPGQLRFTASTEVIQDWFISLLGQDHEIIF